MNINNCFVTKRQECTLNTEIVARRKCRGRSLWSYRTLIRKSCAQCSINWKSCSFNVAKITGSFLVTPDSENGSSGISVSTLNGRKYTSKKQFSRLSSPAVPPTNAIKDLFKRSEKWQEEKPWDQVNDNLTEDNSDIILIV